MFDLCLLFTGQWPGRDDAEVLVNKLTVLGSCRVTMIRNTAHTGVVGVLADFQHKQPTSMMLLHN